MKESTSRWLFFGVFMLAMLFNLYGILHESWEANRSNFYITLGVFGFISLVWIIGNKLFKQ